MTGMRQTIQCSLALTPAHQGEARVTGYQGAESVVAKPAPERPALTEQVHVPDQAYPSRTAGYVTRMPGGVGGVAPRGVPLSRSSTQSRHSICSIRELAFADEASEPQHTPGYGDAT